MGRVCEWFRGGLHSGAGGSWGAVTNNSGIIASPVADLAEPELQSVYSKLKDSGVIAPAPIVRNSNVDVNFMKTLSSYGVISLVTHGMLAQNGDPMLLTGEQSPWLYQAAHLVDWVRCYLDIDISGNWWVRPAFIQHYDRVFLIALYFYLHVTV